LKANTPLRERIYVQTDKHLYLAGEPVLMKIITTDADLRPIALSKIAYVELIDNSESHVQIKIELTSSGTGSGRLILPTGLPSGYYRLIAYTQFMRNEGADVFFEKKIAVINTFQSGYQPAEDEQTSESDRLPSQNAAESDFTVSLQSDKTTYKTRMQGELILTGLPNNIHTLSVSIAGKEFIPVDETDISLFRNNRTKKADSNTINTNRLYFLPEYEGHIVSGKIINNQTGEKEVNRQLAISPCISFPSIDGIRFFAGNKDDDGNVRFFTSGISGTKEIAAVIYDAMDKYRIDIQSPFVSRHIPKQMPELRVDTAYYSQLTARTVALQLFRYFAEEHTLNKNTSESYFRIKPSYSYLLDEYTRFTTMREVFTEFVSGARFSRNAGKYGISVLSKKGSYLSYGMMPLVLLDGVPINDHDIIYSYNPLSVERINIYVGPYIMGGFFFDGIVELITYRRLHADIKLNSSSQILTYEGPQTQYIFNTPDYSDEKKRRSRVPDGRHTLLWLPDVCTDGKNSIRLPFDSSDLTGEFQATVEGFTKDGKIIFASTFFRVEVSLINVSSM